MCLSLLTARDFSSNKKILFFRDERDENFQGVWPKFSRVRFVAGREKGGKDSERIKS